MTRVHLSGRLVCRDHDDVAVVVEHLARHVALTRAEAGCISFEVSPTEDPLVWQVEEWFHDAAAFRAHQDRVSSSEWGSATAGIERHYAIEGL
jgi:quinol monooxygenase YgiN